MNPVITLDPMGPDPSDWKVQNKWFFLSVEINWITRITDPSVQPNRPLMSIIWVLK